MQLQLSLGLADELHETLLLRGEPLGAEEAVRQLVAASHVPAGLQGEILSVLVRHDQRFCWNSPPLNSIARDAPSVGGATGVPLHEFSVSLRHWEAPDPDLADIPFVALDLETTGSRAGIGKITEVGAVRMEGFQQVRHFSTLVNPLRPIPPMITRLTGITQEMVSDAPRIEEVIPELLALLEGAVVVAHNAPFDIGFLNYELRRLKGRRLSDGALDTLLLARALAPGLPNYRLRTVADALGAPVTACHRALADAQAASHVFLTLVGRLQELGVTRLGEALAYANPASRCAADKLRLTRNIPRAPGTYRFVDKTGQILYVGKAERLRERVRSHFVANAGRTRKVRQAIHLVDHIEWDEAATPLEAVVDEQRLILRHRPPCNQHAGRPENYAYVKVGGSGQGLNLLVSCRAPNWLAAAWSDEQETSRNPRLGTTPRSRTPSHKGLIVGPFRGRARLNSAVDLLKRCYPVRRCPRRPDGRPCVRGHAERCLAPCTGDPRARAAHDALVMDIFAWLTGGPGMGVPEPLAASR